MLKIFLISFLISIPALACQPPRGMAVTREAYFKMSEAVFSGKVISKKKIKESKMDRRYELTLKVQKVWKGPSRDKVTMYATSSMCSPLGDMAESGSECIIFTSMENEILVDGTASYCVPKGTKSSKEIHEEFEKTLPVTEQRK